MNLESKAKTVVGIHYLYEQEAEGNFDKENELWIPLEEAKKIIKSLEVSDELLGKANAEIEKWSQQQKDDFATYCEAVSDRDSQIVELKAKIEDAREYTDRALVEHNVSYEFIENYGKKLDPEHKEEWVSTAYLKELHAILNRGKE